MAQRERDASGWRRRMDIAAAQVQTAVHVRDAAGETGPPGGLASHRCRSLSLGRRESAGRLPATQGSSGWAHRRSPSLRAPGGVSQRWPPGAADRPLPGAVHDRPRLSSAVLGEASDDGSLISPRTLKGRCAHLWTLSKLMTGRKMEWCLAAGLEHLREYHHDSYLGRCDALKSVFIGRYGIR